MGRSRPRGALGRRSLDRAPSPVGPPALDDAVQIGRLCWTPYENRVEAISKKSLAELKIKSWQEYVLERTAAKAPAAPVEVELRPAA